MKDFYEMSSPCMQGGYPRVAEGFQTPNHRIGPHSPPMAWQYPPTMQNHQSLTEDRNDSGINSGSDCHSSSPGSESMEGFGSPNSHQGIDQKVGFYSTPIYPKATYNSSIIHPTLQGPSSSFVKQEPEDDDEKDGETTLTSTPNALKCLEMSVERNLNISAASPGLSETSMDDDKRSEHFTEESDDGHKVPRVNSHGKIKTFKCKQCQFVAITKFDFWEHQRQHIKPEKLLTCHKCPFVTEYKHHLEYHLRNHDGSKPFKCEHCDYTCVNKSMLNSHKKSHSNIYQYRCAQCHYASKYCHSLKLHLRKYNHQPAMVLNPDGSPNPLPIIDVYGTRRGPKVKPIHEEEPQTKKLKTETAPEVPSLPLPLQLMTPTPIPLAYSLLQQAVIYQNLERLAREKSAAESSTSPKPHTDTSGALDLTNKNSSENEDLALKLDTPSTSSDEDEEENSTTMFANVEVVQNDEEKPKQTENFTCQYCTISFGDAVLYTMHMGYHGYQDPFACNMCGEKCNDKVAFFLHIARTPHS